MELMQLHCRPMQAVEGKSSCMQLIWQETSIAFTELSRSVCVVIKTITPHCTPQIERHIGKQSESVGFSNEDAYALRQRAAHVATDGTWAKDDVTLATSNRLQQSFLVYVAINSLSPLAYSPSHVSLEHTPLSPLCLAFFWAGPFQSC